MKGTTLPLPLPLPLLKIATMEFQELIKFHNDRLSRELASRSTSAVEAESMAAATIAVSALMGNILDCVAIARNSRLHTPANMLIFALAMTDITMSLTTMPLTVGVVISRRWIYSKVRLPISRFLSSDVGCHLASTDGCLSCEQILVCHKTYLVPTCLYCKEIDQLCSGCQFVRLPPDAVSFDLRARWLPISPGEILLHLRHGAEFHLRSVHGIGIYRLTLHHNVVPVPSNLLLCAKRGVSPIKRKPAECARAGGKRDQDTGRCSGWILVLFDPYRGHPDQLDINNRVPLLPRRVYYMYGMLIYISSAINPILYGFINRSFRAEYKARGLYMCLLVRQMLRLNAFMHTRCYR